MTKNKKLADIIIEFYKDCIKKSNNSLFSVYVENYLRSAIELLKEMKYDDTIINEFKKAYANLMNCTISHVDEFCNANMTTLLRNPITVSQVSMQIIKIAEIFLTLNEIENIKNIIKNTQIPNKKDNTNEYDNSYLYKYPNGYPMNYSCTGDITMPY